MTPNWMQIAMGATMRRLLGAFSALVLAVAAAPAFAQTTANLVRAGGDNPTLVSLGQNIVTICPRLVGQLNAGSVTNPDQVDLTRRCSAAVGAANAEAASGTFTGTQNVLSQIAGDEIIAQDAAISGASQEQTRALAARISSLRGVGGAGQFASLGRYAVVASDAAATGAEGLSRVGQFDGWATASYSDGERDPSRLEGGYEVSGWSILAGADYGYSNTLTLGAALGYADADTDFRANAGSVEGSTVTVAGYAVLTRPGKISGSVYGALNFISYDSSRRIVYQEPATAVDSQAINRVANGSTDAFQYEITGTVDRTFSFGSVDITPALVLSYRKLDIDGFSEDGARGLNLIYRDQEVESFLANIGADAAWRVSTGIGVVSPYLRAYYSYEGLDDSRAISANYRADPFVQAGSSPVIRIQTEEPDRSRVLLGAGLQATFGGGFQGFIDYETVLGLKGVTLNTVAIGLRKEF